MDSAKILVVDDEPSILMLLKEALGKWDTPHLREHRP